MTHSRTFLRSFAGGEMSPEMFGRIEDAKFQSGAARMRNMIPKPIGASVRRPGSKLVREVADSTKTFRLLGFDAGAGLEFVIEVQAGTFRFHSYGQTVGWGIPRLVASVSAGSDTITFTTEHGFNDGDEVFFTHSVVATPDLPDPLAVAVFYYAEVVDDFTIKLYTDAGLTSLVNLTDAGTGTSRAYGGGSRTYVASQNVTAVDFGAANSLTFGSDHELLTDDPIVFTTGTTLPTPLAVDTVYYAIVTAADVIQVSATAGGAAIDLTDAGTGTHRMHFYYTKGDLVRWLGASAGLYYCHATNPQDVTPPTTSHWHLMPVDGIYEIPNFYASSDLPNINHAQSNDVMTIVCPSLSDAELRRTGATRWEFESISFAPTLIVPPLLYADEVGGSSLLPTAITTANPTTITVAGHGLQPGDPLYALGSLGSIAPNTFYFVSRVIDVDNFQIRDLAGTNMESLGSTVGGTFRYCSVSTRETENYVVTAVDKFGDETTASAAASVVSLLSNPGTQNYVYAPSGSPGASRYRFYKLQNGLYGYIGENYIIDFHDDDLDPDLTFTPPLLDGPPAGTNAVGYFEQRRVFGGTTTSGQDVWMTRTGTESSMTYHIPVQDDDRIKFEVNSLKRSSIRHIVPLAQLIILTDKAEYRVTPLDSDALTPASIAVRAQSYVGSSTVRPVIVNNSVLFCANRGGHVYEFGYQQERSGFTPSDISLRAAHLFDGLEVADSALSKAPFQVAWFVSSNGLLLSLTYVPDQQVGAWAWHDTIGGTFETVCVVSEGTEDAVYVGVNRTIGGVTKRYIERLARFDEHFYVESGLTYDGASTTTLSGLDHLEGLGVHVFANSGTIIETHTVSGGAVTTNVAVTDAQVGLPMTAQVQTLPLTMLIDGYGQGRTKGVVKAWVRYFESAQFAVSVNGLPSKSVLSGYATRDAGLEQVTIPASWNDTGQITIEQTNPLPLTVVSLTLETAAGD